jgi:hypothetical protein
MTDRRRRTTVVANSLRLNPPVAPSTNPKARKLKHIRIKVKLVHNTLPRFASCVSDP